MTAVIDKKLGVWLPPSEELEKLIEELAGVKVQASLKDGELRISGTLDALVSAEVSIFNPPTFKNYFISSNLLWLGFLTRLHSGKGGIKQHDRHQ